MSGDSLIERNIDWKALGVGLGWLHEREDREYNERVSVPLSQELKFTAPEEIDPRPLLSIEQQGAMGSCTGNSMSTILEYLQVIQSGGGVETIQFSRAFCYRVGQIVAGIIGDQGCSISACCQGAKQYGVCTEAAFPYPNPVDYRSIRDVPQSAFDEAKPHPVKNTSRMKTYDDIFRWIASGVGAVQIGIPWTQELAQNRNGIINASRGQVLGGHALAFVGFIKDVDSKGRHPIIMINSHGLGWGNKGTAVIAPFMIDKWLSDGTSEFIGLTDLAKYDQAGPLQTRIDFLVSKPFSG